MIASKVASPPNMPERLASSRSVRSKKFNLFVHGFEPNDRNTRVEIAECVREVHFPI